MHIVGPNIVCGLHAGILGAQIDRKTHRRHSIGECVLLRRRGADPLSGFGLDGPDAWIEAVHGRVVLSAILGRATTAHGVEIVADHIELTKGLLGRSLILCTRALLSHILPDFGFSGQLFNEASVIRLEQLGHLFLVADCGQTQAFNHIVFIEKLDLTKRALPVAVLTFLLVHLATILPKD